MMLLRFLAIFVLIALSVQAEDDRIFRRCGKNQVYQRCASACQRHCPAYNDAGELIEIAPICNTMCVARCVCAKGYVEDPRRNNLCVPRSKCLPPLPAASN